MYRECALCVRMVGLNFLYPLERIQACSSAIGILFRSACCQTGTRIERLVCLPLTDLPTGHERQRNANVRAKEHLGSSGTFKKACCSPLVTS